MLEKNSAKIDSTASKKEIHAWAMYDWGNSAFAATVVTAFLGPYMASLIAAQPGGVLHLFGFEIQPDAFYPFCVSASVIMQVVFLPILGTLADYTALKKRLMLMFAYIGAVATMLLFFLQGNTIVFGGLLFIIANLSFGAALVFYNAFLPELAGPGDHDSVSSKGFAYGYVGGGLLLGINLLLISIMEDKALAARISLGSAGLWWFTFTFLFPQRHLKERTPAKTLPTGSNYFAFSLREFWATLVEMKNRYPRTLLYLIAYLVYNDGIQTVNTVAATFITQEIGLDLAVVLQILLMIQFVAAIGAMFFNKIAEYIGAKYTIILNLSIWCGVVIYAYGFLYNEFDSWILGFMIAMVLGSSQALSRSLFAQMIPHNKEAAYFSLYEISERGTSWVGPIVFGLGVQMTGNSRIALLMIIAFFIFGIVMLYVTDVRRAIIDAGHEAPELV
ncbi:MFS transporter [Anaerolineales bacterium HSG6]|nr:MFS transporter [Anaerolineales bacterium HSG6]MDM8532938.1 MFS transporter [Anaerolineales bacterium HSG25]